jgi:hypothetical protein
MVPVSLPGVSAGIRTDHLSNTSLERYGYTNLLGDKPQRKGRLILCECLRPDRKPELHSHRNEDCLRVTLSSLIATSCIWSCFNIIIHFSLF